MQRDLLAQRLSEATLSFLEVLTLYIGDQLGFYRALHDHGPVTPSELAARTGTHDRYVREWLEQQAVSGILTVGDPTADPGSRHYRLSSEHAAVLVDRESVDYQAARPMSLVAAARGLPDLLRAFHTGEGVAFDDDEARRAQAELGRVAYLRHLGTEWIPALPEIETRLAADPPARVADLGCGGGWASIALALAYPKLRIDGFDVDAQAIALARRNAVLSRVESRVSFQVGDAAELAVDGGYQLAVAFETLHDMPRPVEALRAMKRMTHPGGVVLIVDEKVDDRFQVPADPVTRLNYGWSVVCCLASGMLGDRPAGTGAVMRPSILHGYAREAGFREVEVLSVEHPSWRFYRLVS